MSATNVFILIQKEGTEATATRLTMSDRDAGIIAGALARCPGLIPGEICSILGGAFSQLQAVVAKPEVVSPISIPETRPIEDSDVRDVNADRVSQPPPAGVNPVPGSQQAEDPMSEVRRVSEGKPADATEATPPAEPMEEPLAEPKNSDKRKR